MTHRSGDRPAVVVEGLSFRYSFSEPFALRDVSFQVPAGGRLAVVGPSGAGKSTLINLMLRFWDYHEGRIALDGREISRYSEDELRDLVAVVSQRTHLFNASIRENIMIAQPGASNEEMIRAAEAAQLHNFVRSLPQGYDTQVGEQGLRLSGGERQRVAIARALVKNAPVLLLDEATASLDSLTEQRLMGAILSLMEGRTTIMVTHRLSFLEAVDEIVVLEGGCVVEQGRESALLQQSGSYRRMWEAHRQLVPIA